MNYGKRRLFFLTKEQIKEGWILTRHMPDRRPRTRFTVKQWKRFDDDRQMYLTKIFHVILTDHRTRKEKLVALAKKFNKKNMDLGMDKFNKGIDAFSKSLKQIHFDQSAIDPIEGTWGRKTNLPDAKSLMWGSKEKQKKRKSHHTAREPSTKEMFWGNGKDKSNSSSLHL